MEKRIQNKENVPLWEKFTLTIPEAAEYFGIGQCTIRRLVGDNPNADYILWLGTKALIKRIVFEQYLLQNNTI